MDKDVKTHSKPHVCDWSFVESSNVRDSWSEWRRLHDDLRDLEPRQFQNKVSWKECSGETTSFWKDGWVGGAPLCLQFPRLFSIATDKDVKVRELRVREGNMWVWKWLWRRRLFVWEDDLLGLLVEVVDSWVVREDVDRCMVVEARR